MRPIKHRNGVRGKGILSRPQGATMKIAKFSGWMLAAALLLLTGCKNFWNVASSTGGCTSNCSTLSSGIFYVLNSNTGQVEIAGYSIVSGTLTSVSGSPYSLPSEPFSIAIAPNKSFLYVGTQSGIFRYTIGSGGALTLGSTTAFYPDTSAASMQVDSTNSWLIDASASTPAYLYAIPINSADGTRSTTGGVPQVQLGLIPSIHQLAISPDNNNIFLALGTVGTAVLPFNSNPGTGNSPLPATVSTSIGVKTSGGSADSVAVDPLNRLFYIGETLAFPASGSNTNTGGLRAFDYSSLGGVSTPTDITGSPFASGGLTPVSILPDASGAYVYVANSTVSNGTTGDSISTTGNVSGFTFASSVSPYSLTALSSIASTGTTPAALTEDSTRTVVLLVNSGGSPDLDVYTFDATTAGMLDSALTASTGTDPVGATAIAPIP